ncbi:hypothetical protein Q4551_02885 [Oceanobacter sp. 5_MG-2023]|uniref:hypothetical protein n=1 Tax=Oceanobacter sp. 5_MG-2023 TaxID=3062645 RepID=UPI0026E240BE|nr:hypothetical protein [Oceanobacter sp. 5_MG-2023]MDO6681222.1 hypothetical protein [Oceanobacter sp. 5_MG-2023]
MNRFFKAASTAGCVYLATLTFAGVTQAEVGCPSYVPDNNAQSYWIEDDFSVAAALQALDDLDSEEKVMDDYEMDDSADPVVILKGYVLRTQAIMEKRGIIANGRHQAEFCDYLKYTQVPGG